MRLQVSFIFEWALHAKIAQVNIVSLFENFYDNDYLFLKDL